MSVFGFSHAPVGRLAPSPTGALHLGNARTFLIAWLSIRSRGGRLILRIEDLEHPRVKPGAAGQVLEDLRWLGLDWDEGPDIGGDRGPYVQSERLEIYERAIRRLSEAGRIYPCVCSRKETENLQRAPHADEHILVYPGTCRGRFASWEDAQKVMPEGRIPVWRYKTEPGVSEFDDALNGTVRADMENDIGDFALARDRRGAGYTLACVVDDAAMGVTEVVRGDDLLVATHSHIALQRALNLPVPAYMHVPLVVSPDGRRLAKRHGDTRLSSLRESGVSPERVTGLLAWWCGFASFGDEMMPYDLVGRVSVMNMNRNAAVLTDEIKKWLGI